MRIVWVERVSEIAEYIAGDNPGAAEDWTDGVFAKLERLKSFPRRDRIVPEIDNPRIRELIYCNYGIVYRIEEKRLSILTVRHGKQILPADEILP